MSWLFEADTEAKKRSHGFAVYDDRRYTVIMGLRQRFPLITVHLHLLVILRRIQQRLIFSVYIMSEKTSS